jgi:SAM-dependent methyltransferase
VNKAVEEHYAQGGLVEAIRDGLANFGKDSRNLSPEDLAPVDEFHVRGRAATLELAEQLGLRESHHVLDIGSGLGGASRLLAHRYGCRVTGIDLTPAYCDAARTLAEWVQLSPLVAYRQGNALALPFPAETFDAAVTLHVSMNIPNKGKMYSEARRVFKPEGVFAVYDILQGEGGGVLYPVPWARDSSISFLATPEEMRTLLQGAGFEVVSWRDTTAEGRAWFRELAKRMQETGVPPLGFHILLGAEFAVMAANQRRNLEEDRIELAEIVCRSK